MNRRTLALLGIALGTSVGAFAAASAGASECPGNPGALGTSRVLTIDPREYPRIGSIQYSQSLPLYDKEVVLTFDDGPLPPYTNRVLEVLAEQCVKANYFIIGRMARGYAGLLRQVHAAGHVIGTHSENHPLSFERMPLAAVQGEIDQGIASVAGALGDRKLVAPFFRIPGLLRAPQVEGYLQSRGLVTWSADVVADDWKHIAAAEVVRRTIGRLEEKGKGILLLHDIQPATALALPELLRQLKSHGFRIVQVAPGKAAAPAPVAAKPSPPAPVAARPVPSATGALARNVAESETEPPAAPTAAAAAEPSKPDTPLGNAIAEVGAVLAAEAAGTRPEDPARAAAARPARTPQAPSGEPPASEAAPGEPDAPVRDAAVARASAPRPPDPAIPREPVLPFTETMKPAHSVTTPGKLTALEPGGWPPAVKVPLPSAGGVGVSPIVRTSDKPDGRFQESR